MKKKRKDRRDVVAGNETKYRKVNVFGTEIYLCILVSAIGRVLSALALAFCLPVSGSAALVCALCMYLFRAMYFMRPWDFKTVVPFMTPIIVVFIASLVLGRIELIDNWSQIVELAARIAAVVFMAPFALPIFVKDYGFSDGCDIINKQITARQVLILRVLMWAYRILMLGGCIGAILGGFFFSFVALLGVVSWAALIFIKEYYYQHCPDLPPQEAESYAEDNDYAEQSESSSQTSSGERAINDYAVEQIVKKIADKWSYKSYYPIQFSENSIYIQYQVSVEPVRSEFINYTVNGKVRFGREEDWDFARKDFDVKVSTIVFYEISEETKRELSKHTLMRSSGYEISVQSGNLRKA